MIPRKIPRQFPRIYPLLSPCPLVIAVLALLALLTARPALAQVGGNRS